MRRNPLEAGVSGLTLAALIAGCTATAAEPAPTSTPTLVPTATPRVRFEATATPTPPSDPEKILVLPTIAELNQVPPTLSERVRNLQRILEYPTIISVGGRSFKEFMKEKGYSFFIKPVPPKTGFVQPRIGLKTRELPITEEGIKELDKKYWKQYEDKVLWSVEIIVEKNDGTIKERWAAMLMPLEIAGNPPAERWVFIAIESKEREKVAVTFIK